MKKYFQNVIGYLTPDSPQFLRSKTQIRDYIYKDGINIIAWIDQQICMEIFQNPLTPFRITKGGDVIDDCKERIEQFRVAIDVFQYMKDTNDPDIISCLKQASTFTINDIYERRDEWKALCKVYRNESFTLDKQFILSFFRSLYVVQEAQVTVPMLTGYLEEFERDEPTPDDFEISESLVKGLPILAQSISRFIEGEDYPIQIPICSNAASSCGRKKIYDYNRIIPDLYSFSEINTYAKHFLIRCFKAIAEVYHADMSEWISLVESKSDSIDCTNMLYVLPRATTVSQNKGKVSRLIFMSNDIADLALNPGMRVMKTMKLHLSSCMSTDKAPMESNYTYTKKKADRWRQGINVGTKSDPIIIKSDMEGADSSNATERINGRYMCKLFKQLWSFLSDSAKNALHISKEYIDICADILCDTPFVVFNDGQYHISFSYGTAQGLMQSWDLLDLTTMLTIYESYIMYLEDHYKKARISSALKMLNYSANMGDDGLYAHLISDYFKRNLQRVSLQGVINYDKTENEDSVGYAPFASAYVKSGNSVPKILSNIRIISTLAKLSFPESYEVTQQDRYDRMQLQLVRKTIDLFREVYNKTHRVMIDNDQQTLADYQNFSYAEKVVKFAALQQAINFNDLGKFVPIPETSIGLSLELTPSYRARTVTIRNMAISSDKLYVLASCKQLESCYEGVESLLSDIDRDLEQARDFHFKQGIPWNEIVLDFQNQLFHAALEHCGLPGFSPVFSFSNLRLTQYECTFIGYFNSNMIINCKYTEWR